MWYIIIAGCLLIGVYFTTRLRSCNTSNQSENSNISLNSADIANDTIKGMFSKKQIDQKLKRLAETDPPKELSFGAMCYKVAFENFNVFEYICPTCGEKTVYKRGKNNEESWIIENLEKNLNLCRSGIGKIKGINIKLDESLLCKHCSPDTDSPSLCLWVNISGQSDTTKVCNVNSKDIQILGEFLNDKLLHSGSRDEETPLVNNLARIKELLGMK